MNKCQSFCRTIQRLCNKVEKGLPVEYQQVEYLKSNKSQYIDTQINPTTGDVLTVKMKFSGGHFYNQTIMGAQQTYRTAVVYGYTNDDIGIGAGDRGAASSNSVFSSLLENTLDFTMDDANKLITGTHNGVALASTSYSNTYAGRNIYLYDNNGVSGQKASVAIYYWKCYINGAKVADYIPCYRKSDNKPGMYDLVSNTFFINAGTGEFTVGDNV